MALAASLASRLLASEADTEQEVLAVVAQWQLDLQIEADDFELVESPLPESPLIAAIEHHGRPPLPGSEAPARDRPAVSSRIESCAPQAMLMRDGAREVMPLEAAVIAPWAHPPLGYLVLRTPVGREEDLGLWKIPWNQLSSILGLVAGQLGGSGYHLRKVHGLAIAEALWEQQGLAPPVLVH